MGMFKAYLNGIQDRYGEMMDELGLDLIRIGKDVDGSFMLLYSSNGIFGHMLEDYSGIRNVYKFYENPSREFFKSYLNIGKEIDVQRMDEEFGLKIREIGNEKRGRKDMPFMIIEGDRNVYPEQIREYDFVKNVKILVNYTPPGEVKEIPKIKSHRA